MKPLVLLLVAMLALSATNTAANPTDDVKKQINSIKKSSLYIYAEATLPTEEEAHDLAEEILYEEINAWAARQKKLRKSTNFVVNNRKELWVSLSLPRGNMYRSFLYVKKSDILPADNSDVIENTTQAVTTEVAVEKERVPDAVATIAACTLYTDMAAKIKQLKTEGQIVSYARYASLDEPDAYYLAVYNTAGQVVAVLTPGKERRNVKTGEADSTANYKGCGAIGFKVK